MNKEMYREMKKAIKQGDLLAVKKIVSDTPQILGANTPFGTWLQIAASYGQTEMVNYFIECDIDVNKSSDVIDGGPLGEACAKGYIDIVKILLEKGAVLDVSSAAKNPMFAAIYGDNIEVVKYLVDKGIDTKVTYAIGDIEECDAYEYARQYGRTEIAEYLKALR